MKKTDSRHGPAPDTDAMADLIVERYPIRANEKVTITAAYDPTPGLELALTAGRDRYTIGVHYLRGANGRDPWSLVTDALDALFGTFLESERAYRELPQGHDVEWDGAFFRVDVAHAIPELDARADRMLEHD